MKAAVLFSGGKDSCLALHIAEKEGYKIEYLLSVLPENPDSFMFHKPDLRLLGKQAEMLDIELIIIESEGKKEQELIDLKKLINKVRGDIEAVVVGGIASSYQSKRIKKICEEFGLEFYAPLWDFDEERIWKELLKKGFKVILTKISCEGLSEGWLGKVIDEKRFGELKELSEMYGFRLDFEGGEAESAVLWMEGFKKSIKIRFNIRSEGEYRSWIEIKEAR